MQLLEEKVVWEEQSEKKRKSVTEKKDDPLIHILNALSKIVVILFEVCSFPEQTYYNLCIVYCSAFLLLPASRCQPERYTKTMLQSIAHINSSSTARDYMAHSTTGNRVCGQVAQHLGQLSTLWPQEK